MIKAVLADVCSIQSGGTPSRGNDSYWGGSIPWAKISDLEASGDGYISDTEENITEQGLGAIRGRIFNSGTLLFAMYGSVGKVAVVRGSVSANQAILGIKPDTSRLDLSYLKFWLRSQQGRFDQDAQGVAQKNLSAGYVRSLEIPLPPLREQKRIAAILDKADAIRRKRQQAIKIADDFLRAVFLDMFGDPVTNPKRWDVVKLGTLIVFGPNNGLYKPSSDYGVGARILRIDGFYLGEVISESNLKRVRVSEDERTKFSLNVGDVVINRVNSREYLGKTALIRSLEEDVLYESNMMRFAIDARKIDPEYFICLMQQPFIRSQILASAKDAVNQSSINQQDVKSLEILLPPIALQKKYRNMISMVRNCKEKLVSHRQLTHGLLGSLVQKALQGEV